MIKKLFERFVGRKKLKQEDLPSFCEIVGVEREEMEAVLAKENKQREIQKLKKAAMLGKEDKSIETTIQNIMNQVYDLSIQQNMWDYKQLRMRATESEKSPLITTWTQRII